jgi:hypothetical protein
MTASTSPIPPPIRKTLEATGFNEPTVHYAETAAAALEQIKTSPIKTSS